MTEISDIVLPKIQICDLWVFEKGRFSTDDLKNRDISSGWPNRPNHLKKVEVSYSSRTSRKKCLFDSAIPAEIFGSKVTKFFHQFSKFDPRWKGTKNWPETKNGKNMEYQHKSLYPNQK